MGNKACIITGRNSARANGSYDDAVKALEANGQAHALYDKVMSNPTDTCVFRAAAYIKSEGCDFVIALGGGSPMDAAKAAAILAVNDISKEEFFGLSFKSALPLAAVPTTAGTGSETTQYAVLVDTTGPDGKSPKEGGPAKRSIGSPLIFPRYAFLDPRYMLSLSRDNTVNTAIDALSHAVEGMLTVRASFLSDTLARESIAMIRDCFDPLINFPGAPEDFPLELRERLLAASAVAGMVIAQTGTTAVHSMGYQLTLNLGADHGRANGLLLRAFLKWCQAREKAPPAVTPRIPALCAALGMDLDQFGAVLDKLLDKREEASAAQLEEWAEKSSKVKNVANCYIKAEKEEILELFRASVIPLRGIT
jgi:alcohol dehydrogenase class IV